LYSVRKTADERILTCSISGASSELPKLTKAIALRLRLDTEKWPVIVKTGLEVDQEFLSVFKDTGAWLPKAVTTLVVSNGLATFLTPFPIFKSLHLHIKQDGLVGSRELTTLYDDRLRNVGKLLDHSADDLIMHSRQTFSGFSEMLNVAKWMCEDLEQSLYTKRFETVPARSSEVCSGNGIEDDDGSVQIDAQSQASMSHYVSMDYGC
jgi:hypothetical protein